MLLDSVQFVPDRRFHHLAASSRYFPKESKFPPFRHSGRSGVAEASKIIGRHGFRGTTSVAIRLNCSPKLTPRHGQIAGEKRRRGGHPVDTFLKKAVFHIIATLTVLRRSRLARWLPVDVPESCKGRYVTADENRRRRRRKVAGSNAPCSTTVCRSDCPPNFVDWRIGSCLATARL